MYCYRIKGSGSTTQNRCLQVGMAWCIHMGMGVMELSALRTGMRIWDKYDERSRITLRRDMGLALKERNGYGLDTYTWTRYIYVMSYEQ